MIVGIVGAGGFGREVLPLARLALPKAKLCFVETTPSEARHSNGVPVVDEETFLRYPGDKSFAIAIADSEARRSIADRFIAKGVSPTSLLAPSAASYENNVIGEGALICANVVITSDVTIGRFFHANIGSYVAHDCVIGDFVTFAPMVCCNGNVQIGDGAYIGTGAMLRQGATGEPLRIGSGATIGMGAVVTRDVPVGETWVGVPARKLTKA